MQPDTEQTLVIYHNMHTAITLPEAGGEGEQGDDRLSAPFASLSSINTSDEDTLNMAAYKPFSLPSRRVTDMTPRLAQGSLSLYAFSSLDVASSLVNPHHLLPDGASIRPAEQPAAGQLLPGQAFYPLLVPALPTEVAQSAHAGVLTLLPLLLGTAFVLLLYLVTPVAVSLLPFLPTFWSRLLISLELLILVEWLICRVLYKTTKR